MNPFRLTASLLYSVTGLIRYEGSHALRRIGPGIVAVAKALLRIGPQETPARRQARLRCCESCPIFFARHRTCGNAHETDPSQFYTDTDGVSLPMGCFCLCDLKARAPGESCWAFTQGLDIGWIPELNGDMA